MTATKDLGLAMPATQTPEIWAEIRAQEARATDTPEIATLVDVYSPLLFRIANSALRNRSEAEDAVQDTFLRVLEHSGKLRDVRDMRVWLIRITWNLALDRRRRMRPDQIDPAFARTLVAPGIPADRMLAEAGRMSCVLGEIERLPKREREVLLLSAVEELSNAEIAVILGRSESASRALLFRARSRLRERMEKGDQR